MAKRTIVVIGGGAAGLIAAGQAAEAGAEVRILEKMHRPGRKLCITGKGRCNVTNVAELSDFIKHFGKTGSFLEKPFSICFTDEIMNFFATLGLDLVTERGGRVFPTSGRAPEVLSVLEKWLESKSVSIECSSPVSSVTINDGCVTGVVSKDREIACDAVILATGGTSYPRTGSTGDGYKLAESAGHSIVPVRPALVPLETTDDAAGQMAGLNLRNINVTEFIDGEKGREAFGEIVFSEFGVTGPVILTLSGRIVDLLSEGRSIELSIDLKPALSKEKLEARLERDFEKRKEESLGSVLRGLIPREMIPVCLKTVGLSGGTWARKITAGQRAQVVDWLKDVRLEVSGHRPIDEAIVTAGGVDTKEIDPQSMESRITKGLYIVGELLDIQGDTGGYNLQAAFSTGWLAGRSAVLGPQAIENERPEKGEAKSKRGEKPTKQGKTGQFLPTTKEELKQLGWEELDVILVTGDAYIDSPFIGVAVVGKVLVDAGYRVGIIAQPDISTESDITRLGEPKLFWGVTAGCIDSLVANRTATGKKRKSDDYTPGGVNDKRPDRASIAYSNLIRKHFKNTRPIVLGGIEASLRRIAHYDFWSDKIRKSILFDAKADYLLYGMAERSIVQLAERLSEGAEATDVRGLCYIAREKPDGHIELPSFSDASADKDVFTEMFHTFYQNNDPVTAKGLIQQQDTRWLVQNPPAKYPSQEELDKIYELSFENELHPYYRKQGDVKALLTIRFSIATHRGCYGECNFCAIAVHQGRTIRWRSKSSILAEAERMTKHPLFKGTIHDVGGPTANMYGFECTKKAKEGCCPDKRCLYPQICDGLGLDHREQINLLKELKDIKGIKRVIVASGIRHDMVMADKKYGMQYLEEIVCHHVSGQLKVAPEHSEKTVLDTMGKPYSEDLLKFREKFYKITKKAGKDQYLTYYMIAAHPGCTGDDMARLKDFAIEKLQLRPEQVQVFTPTPSTYSTLMYWTEKNPFTGEPCFVEKGFKGKERQKRMLSGS
jgi:uncharacterized radical SAM protein YgiQ